MRKTAILPPRDQRETWQVNCYEDGHHLYRVQAVTEIGAYMFAKKWNEGERRTRFANFVKYYKGKVEKVA